MAESRISSIFPCLFKMKRVEYLLSHRVFCNLHAKCILGLRAGLTPVIYASNSAAFSLMAFVITPLKRDTANGIVPLSSTAERSTVKVPEIS